MAESKDIEAREPTAEELLVLDLLYGELDGDDAERAQARVSEQPERADELDGFASVRALMRELPDEDPPQAVSARLLHAAAEAAPSKGSAGTAAAAAGGGGILAKLFGVFRPLVASPALAAVTMLVLVAGIAGALYVSGGFHATEPKEEAAPMREQLQPTTPASPDVAAPPAATESPAVGGESDDDPNAVGRNARLDEGEVDLAPMAEPEAPAEAKDDKVQTRKPAAHRRASSSSSTSTRGHGTTATGSMGGANYEETGKAEATKASSSGAARGPGGVKGTAADTPMIDAEDYDQGAAAPAPAQQMPPPPPAEPEPKPTSKSKKKAPAKQKPTDKSAEKSVMVQDLYNRAVQAAKDGECEAVRSLGARIRSLDSTYYAKVFATDKRLAACRTAPAKK